MPHFPLLSRATTVVRTDGHVEAEIDNEIVALNIETGTCYGLNRVASRIWSLLEHRFESTIFACKLVSEYQGRARVCERQVLDLLEELRAEGMIAMLEEE